MHSDETEQGEAAPRPSIAGRLPSKVGRAKGGIAFILKDVEPASLFLIKREVTFCSLALLSSMRDYPRPLPCFTHHFFSPVWFLQTRRKTETFPSTS